MIEPFHVHVSSDTLADLHSRLRSIRWPRGVTDSGGIALNDMEEVVRYWLEDYDWPAHEREINRLPHFRVVCSGGLRLHYIHTTAGRPGAIPLLLLHGWPGSFIEMLSLVPHLADSYDLIIPSLPGFAFSDAPESAGMSNERIAELLAELMTQLGHERFAVHGGDVGAGIATWLARRFPHRVHAIHLNYVPGSYAPFVANATTGAEREFLQRRSDWAREHGAYAHLQGTRPLTLAYALSDSALGLAAWIVEKFVSGPIRGNQSRSTQYSRMSHCTGRRTVSRPRCACTWSLAKAHSPLRRTSAWKSHAGSSTFRTSSRFRHAPG